MAHRGENVKPLGNGKYEFRKAVPVALVATFDKREFKQVFTARDPDQARRIGEEWDAHYKREIAKAKGAKVAWKDPKLDTGPYAGLAKAVNTVGAIVDMNRQLRKAGPEVSTIEIPTDEDGLKKLYQQIRNDDYDVKGAVDEHFAANGIYVPTDSEMYQTALQFFKPYTLGEIAKLIKASRIRSFEAMQTTDLAQFDREVLGIVDKPKPAAPTLGEFYRDHFLKHSVHAHIVANRDEKDKFDNVVQCFIDAYGDLPINKINRTQTRQFFDDLTRYPARRDSKSQKMKFHGVIAYHAKRGDKKLTVRTINVWKRTLKRIYDFAIEFHDEEWGLGKNPFDISGQYLGGRDSVTKRHFKAHEITAMFSDPMFSGELDHRAWLMLMLLFHGSRTGEWANQPLDAIRQDPKSKIWYLDVGRSKTRAGTDRTVPIHQFILDLGFIEKWVMPLRAKGSPYLWPQFRRGGRMVNGVRHVSKEPSAQFSQWAGRFIDHILGEDRTISLHSFRHTWVTRATKLKIDREWRKAIVGHAADKHADDDVHDRYTHLDELPEKKAEMDKIVFEGFPYERLGFSV